MRYTMNNTIRHIARAIVIFAASLIAATWAWAQASALPLPIPIPAPEEVPFVTTPDNVTLEMLRIADVRAADHVIDLGSGDGRIVISAAREFGASGLGVDIVPDLVKKSTANAQTAGVAARTNFLIQDIFQTDLSRATVVTMYLLPEVNMQLRPRLLQLAPGTRIVSHDWDMGDWFPDRSTLVSVPNKAVGRERYSRVHLWRVPARVEGTWCAGRNRLVFVQRYQDYEASLQVGSAAPNVWRSRIDGASISPPNSGPSGTSLPSLRQQADALIVDRAGAGVEVGTRFTRADDGRCAP